MERRDLIRAGIVGAGAGLAAAALAQRDPAVQAARIARERGGRSSTIPNRKLKITRLFKSPEGAPNAIAASNEGLWIGEQLTEDGQGTSNSAYLVDWSGKVLRKLPTATVNTSGMGYGGGYLWMGGNGQTPAGRGILQLDPMTGRTISHRQIPLGQTGDGGGCHGVLWHDGKLWITALRMRGLLRVDPVSWQPEFFIPYAVERSHATAWQDGSIWMVSGALNGPSDSDDTAGLVRYDATTGRLLETASFDQADVDPHGIAIHNGVMYGCDAGIHPQWADGRSPSSGYIFRIDPA